MASTTARIHSLAQQLPQLALVVCAFAFSAEHAASTPAPLQSSRPTSRPTTLAEVAERPSVELSADEINLAALVSEARAVVEAGLELELPAELEVRYTTRDELSAELAGEAVTKHQLALTSPALDLGADDERAEIAMRPLASVVIAKHFPAERRVLVALDNLAASMAMIGFEAERATGLLRAVLVHELIHVADEQRFNWSAKLLECTTSQCVQSLAAVVEGHAQYVARDLCASAGWSADFEEYTSMIGFSPALGEGEGMAFLSRAMSVAFSFSYHSGEAFWQTIMAAGDENMEARAFASPPASVALISRPDWYLDPASRPESAYDLVRGTQYMADRVPADEWIATPIELTLPQLQEAIKILPEDERAAAEDAFQSAQLMVLQPKDAPQSAMFAGALIETKDTLGAAHWLTVQERVMRLKDEAMTEGSMRIVAADYQQLALPTGAGLHASKTVDFMGTEVDVDVLIFTSGSLMVELTASNHEIERQELIDTAVGMFAAAMKPDEPAAAQAK